MYSFLQHALLRVPEAFPVRGPEHFAEEPFTYRNARHGDVENFWGEEIIDHRGTRVYVGWYAGGLVDLRRGD